MKYRFLMYGEQTTQLNMRVPESKKGEIQKKFEEILKTYENPKRVEVSSGIEKPKEVKKVEKPPKKIEPQVVVDELDEEDLLYAEYEKLEGKFEVLDKMPILCVKTDTIVNGHNVWTDNTFFYARENNGKTYKWHKFDRIEFAVFYIEDNLIRKN